MKYGQNWTYIPELQPHGHLGGVVVSVLATGLKGRGLEPGKGDRFFRVIKIRSTPSSRCEIKLEAPCHKILMHVKDLLKSHGDRQNSHFLCPPPIHYRDISDGRKPDSTGGWHRDVFADRTTTQYWGLPECSGRQVGS
jgi:hypothetical protein